MLESSSHGVPKNNNTGQRTSVLFNEPALSTHKEDFGESSWRTWVRSKSRCSKRGSESIFLPSTNSESLRDA